MMLPTNPFVVLVLLIHQRAEVVAEGFKVVARSLTELADAIERAVTPR